MPVVASPGTAPAGSCPSAASSWPQRPAPGAIAAGSHDWADHGGGALTAALWDEAVLASRQPGWLVPPAAAPQEPPRASRHLGIALVAALLAMTGTTSVAAAVIPGRTAPGPAPTRAVGRTDGASPIHHVLARSRPTAIDIPAIGVHSTLQTLGLTAGGVLEVPAPGPRYNDAAWYRYSPTPGQLGPAVISGHVDSAKFGRSVFFRLGDLRPGDSIDIDRVDGRRAHFTVDGVRVYPKDKFPTALVYGNTDRAALRLLTCGGPFDKTTGHYADNVIVFATLADPGPPPTSA